MWVLLICLGLSGNGCEVIVHKLFPTQRDCLSAALDINTDFNIQTRIAAKCEPRKISS